MSDIIFETLPFRVYNHMFNCNRGFYVYNKCIFCTRFHVREKALYDFLSQKLVFLPDFFPNAITEDIILENDVFLFAHYHRIIYSSRDRNFENNYGNFGVLYYECINSAFVLYNFYLEMLCRIIFNNVDKKILPKLFSDYDANNLYDCRQSTIYNKKLCPAFEKKQITSVLIKETAYYCLHVLKLNQTCINTDFIKHISESC